MGVLGIGTDLVELARIERSYAKFGSAFLAKILTDAEQAYCLGHQNPIPSIGARFAAKEALVKALGCGIGIDAEWQDIEVKKSERGAPYLVLGGRAKNFAKSLGVNEIFLSLSHTETMATATVLVQS